MYTIYIYIHTYIHTHTHIHVYVYIYKSLSLSLCDFAPSYQHGLLHCRAALAADAGAPSRQAIAGPHCLHVDTQIQRRNRGMSALTRSKSHSYQNLEKDFIIVH